MDCSRAPIAAYSPSMSCPILREKFRSACSTSCRKAMCRLRATRCVCLSMWRWCSAPILRTTPLKDRIGSEIRTHYPATVDEAITITTQEAWTKRDGYQLQVPDFVRQVIEQIAFIAREDKRIDKRSGVSQRLPISELENVVSNAERRAIRS